MSVKEKVKEMIGSSLVEYDKLNVDNKTNIDQLKFTEEYQNRIISCMVGEVDDNYIETPETDAPIVKLENSREGLVKVPSIKGKTILIDIDGNETDTPAEGCKLVSVGEEEDNKLIILSNNINLVNIDETSFFIYDGITPNKDAYISKENNGFIYGGNIVPVTEYNIKFKPNTTYAINGKPLGGSNRMRYEILIDGNKVSDSGYKDDINYHHIFTTPNTQDFKVSFKIWSCVNTGEYLPTYGVSDVFIYEYVNKKDFEPNQHHKTENLFNEPLRSLPNGVCDEIVDNRLIRRIGRVVLDGVGSWGKYSTVEDYKTEGFFVNFTTIKENIKPNGLSYCSQYPHIRNNADNETLWIGSSSLVLRINKSKLTELSKDGLIQYLKENPIEVLYELETPIIEELPNSITLQGFDDTTMYLENKITPTVQYGYNALIPFKEGAIAQGKKSEANAQDIDESIVPFMMDIEYQILTL